MTALPIDPLLEEIAERTRDAGVLVLEAEPGAGKTTRVPLALLRGGASSRGQILVTEPRRLAARLAARFVAGDLGEAPGRTVGYSVRFEQVAGPETRVLYVTEGVLLRRLLEDPTLTGVDVVVLDEVHERHLETDLLLALLVHLRETRRPDLRLVAMSATLEAERLAAFLGSPRVRSEGRAFPLDIEHLDAPDDRPLERQVSSAVRRLLAEDPQGDVLVFVPGAGEIRRALERLDDIARERGADVLPLHGDLPLEDQARAVERGPRRKIILSTNVAESSVTVEGVTAVVDTGLARVASHSPWSGLPTLEVARISRASAIQRAGRAGRVRPGRVLRLFTRGDFEGRPAHDKPEVARLDLTEALLLLHGLGVADPGRLRWFEAPPPPALAAGEALLRDLRATDDRGALSALGRRMLRFPLPPRLARLVVAGEHLGVADDACLAAGLLGERDIRAGARTDLGRGTRALDAPTGPSDVLELMDRFREAEHSGLRQGRLRSLGLDERSVRSVAETYKRLRRLARDDAPPPADADAAERALCRALLGAYPDRVARRRTPGGRSVVLSSGATAELAEASVVRDTAFLVALDADRRSGRSSAAVVRLASAIDPEWLLEDHGERVETTDELVWNPERQRVDRVSRFTLGSVVLDEDRSPAPPSPEAAELVARAAREQGLARDAAVEALRIRLELLQTHLPELPRYELGEAAVDAALEQLASGATSLEELDARHLADTLTAALPADLRRALDQEAPERLTLRGGRILPVHYERDRPPWIASRLQDFFGATEGPRICRGRLPLTLHLLAPNQRAVQVTQDLAGFWDRHYPALRKELGRRYPRHPFPEDPRTARPPEGRGPRRG
jgi:ATP-dependent helicase HrpB